MKRITSVLLASSLILTLAACGGGAAETPAPAPESNAPTVESQAPAPAEPSGKLVIYSPNSDTQINSSLEAFKAAYPKIDVELQSMGTGDVLARI